MGMLLFYTVVDFWAQGHQKCQNCRPRVSKECENATQRFQKCAEMETHSESELKIVSEIRNKCAKKEIKETEKQSGEIKQTNTHAD